MTVLQDLARELGISDRTLRRAIADGAIRAERPSARRVSITDQERHWVLRHWPTVALLRQALRTEPSVRLAVLFGSQARGREHRQSDLDVLIALDAPTPARLADLEERLSAAAARQVQVVSLGDAEASPGLMADALRDGRVLADRDALWAQLQQRAPDVRSAAQRRDAELLERALRPLEAGR